MMNYKRLFWIALLLLVIFELANVYFIMPMPGSQQMDSLAFAYFLYSWRWWFRAVLAALVLVGLFSTHWKRKWVPVLSMLPALAIIYVLNFQMAADKMFRQVQHLVMVSPADNKVDSNRLVIGVEWGNEARAYPIRFLGYHHFLTDTIDGRPILVTYCTVCRTGRVYDPVINGKTEQFRLVGMDHFNAIIEDASTGSWWQQVTGVAVAGKMKGMKLPEVLSTQSSLAEWIKENPQTLIMQEDPAFANKYDTTLQYENGTSKKLLTGTDSSSWQRKSWVVGIEQGGSAKAFDWNVLKATRLIQDTVGTTNILLSLSRDHKSFYAFQLPANAQQFRLINDTMECAGYKYLLNGKSLGAYPPLSPIAAYQEFWHSWRQFHPGTTRYPR
jgi:hypothetical protein